MCTDSGRLQGWVTIRGALRVLQVAPFVVSLCDDDAIALLLACSSKQPVSSYTRQHTLLLWCTGHQRLAATTDHLTCVNIATCRRAAGTETGTRRLLQSVALHPPLPPDLAVCWLPVT